MERKLAKYIILISLILFTSQIFSQSQIKLLERAYDEDSDSLMNVFFDNWKRMTPYNYNNYSDANDTLIAIKEIYKSFYDTLDFFKEKRINLLPNDMSYSIVKRILLFQWYEDPRFYDIFEENTRRDTLFCPEVIIQSHVEEEVYSSQIHNFRPKITEEKLLFLDSLYSGRLNVFLTGNSDKNSFVNVFKNLDLRPDEFLARFNFLSNYIPIRNEGERVHDKNKIFFYNKSLNLLQQNSIERIQLDKTLTFAILTIYGDCEVLFYYLYKNENKWIIKRRTGMCICG
jgi:hypothetical protein